MSEIKGKTAEEVLIQKLRDDGHWEDRQDEIYRYVKRLILLTPGQPYHLHYPQGLIFYHQIDEFPSPFAETYSNLACHCFREFIQKILSLGNVSNHIDYGEWLEKIISITGGHFSVEPISAVADPLNPLRGVNLLLPEEAYKLLKALFKEHQEKYKQYFKENKFKSFFEKEVPDSVKRNYRECKDDQENLRNICNQKSVNYSHGFPKREETKLFIEEIEAILWNLATNYSSIKRDGQRTSDFITEMFIQLKQSKY